MTRGFPSQRARNVESVPIVWRHNENQCDSKDLTGTFAKPKMFLLEKRTELQEPPQWRIWVIAMTSYGRHVVLNHRSYDYLFNSLCGYTLKNHQSPRHWPFVRGIHRWPVNSPVTGEFPAQRASKAEKASIWWRHHGAWSPIVIQPNKTQPNCVFISWHILQLLRVTVNSTLQSEAGLPLKDV